MMSIKEKKELRFQFLRRLYELQEQNPNLYITYHEIGQQLGIPSLVAENIADYLEGEQLIKILTHEGAVDIKHAGKVEVEQALSEPEEPTEHFPPIITMITNHGTMNGLSFQQGTTNSTQNSTVTIEQGQDLQEIITQLKALQAALKLSQEEKDELQSDITTLEAQVKSPKPKNIILSETLKSVKGFLFSVGTKATTHAIDKATPEVIEMIDKWLGQQPN